jgi:hypothetical protein
LTTISPDSPRFFNLAGNGKLSRGVFMQTALEKNNEKKVISQYWGFRELTEEELMLIGGGESEDGDEVPVQETPLPEITVHGEREYGASFGEGLSFGGAAGSTAALTAAVAGGVGFAAAGEAVMAGAIVGGVVGVVAVGIGIGAVAAYDYFQRK